MTKKTAEELFGTIDYNALRTAAQTAAQVPGDLRDRLFEIEDAIARSGIPFPLSESLFSGLKQYKIEEGEAQELVEYSWMRVKRHSDLVEGSYIYSPQYHESDKSISLIPQQISSMGGDPEKRSAKVGLFFSMAKVIGDLQEFNGGEFVKHLDQAFSHLRYLRGLDEDHLLTLAALQGYGFSWNTYDSQLTDDFMGLEKELAVLNKEIEKKKSNDPDPADSERRIVLKKSLDDFDAESKRLTAIKSYENEHGIKLKGYYQFLINENLPDSILDLIKSPLGEQKKS